MAQVDEKELATVDATPVDAIASLPRDLAIIKMENDQIFSLAASHPRDYGEVLADIRSQLQTFKSFAQSAMYAKPVGGGKHARGLSIRAAEALAAAYKFNRVRVDVEEVNRDAVKVEATFVDYATGRVWQDAGMVSKNYKRKGGGTARWDDDRFYGVVVKAEASRRVREVILRCVPPGLRAELENVANEEMDKFLDESTTQKIVAQFSTKGVTQEMLEENLGKRSTDWNQEDRRTLLGLWNGIDQGEMTVAQAFGKDQSPLKDHAQDLANELGARMGAEPEAPKPEEPPPLDELTDLRDQVREAGKNLDPVAVTDMFKEKFAARGLGFIHEIKSEDTLLKMLSALLTMKGASIEEKVNEDAKEPPSAKKKSTRRRAPSTPPEESLLPE
jgi:hypothetical protein